MADPVRVNGNLFSWGSIEIQAAGEVIVGASAVSYSHTRERSTVYGAAPQRGPVGVTTGRYAAEGSITLYAHTAAMLRDVLDDGGGSYGDTPFDVVVSYAEDGLPPHTVEMRDCLITGESVSETEGTDATAVELSLWVREVYLDGATLAEVP